MALLPALVQIAVGGSEMSGVAGVLEQLFEQAEGVGREFLAGYEAGPEAAVIFGDAAGADDAEFVDELALDGIDFATELGKGHGLRLLFL